MDIFKKIVVGTVFVGATAKFVSCFVIYKKDSKMKLIPDEVLGKVLILMNIRVNCSPTKREVDVKQTGDILNKVKKDLEYIKTYPSNIIISGPVCKMGTNDIQILVFKLSENGMLEPLVFLPLGFQKFWEFSHRFQKQLNIPLAIS